MYNATEQFAEINKAGYDNAVKLATMSLDKAEQLAKLNLQAAKIVLENGVYTAARSPVSDTSSSGRGPRQADRSRRAECPRIRVVYQIAPACRFSALAE